MRGGGRVCQVVGLGQTDERIVAFDPETRTLSYTLQAEKLPPALSRMQNTWTVRADAVHLRVPEMRRACSDGVFSLESTAAVI